MKVCAGIVLYNPEISLLKKNINQIIDQVDVVILFDNASNNYSEINDMLSEYDDRLIYIKNDINAGIAYALNRILDIAEQNNYDWCLTMDQDSICSDNLIEEYSKHLNNENNALISAFILNNGKYTIEQYRNLELPESEILKRPIECITSATLNRISIVKELGGYNEALFIDSVDTELNCRIIKAGYSIIRCNKVYLIQAMGNAKNIPLLSKLYDITRSEYLRRMQTISVYSDLRLYYQSRNSRYIRKKFKNMEKRVSLCFMILLFCYFTLFYPLSRNRLKMWKNIIKGFFDYKELKNR